MKKLTAMIMACVVVLALVSCSSAKNDAERITELTSALQEKIKTRDKTEIMTALDKLEKAVSGKMADHAGLLLAAGAALRDTDLTLSLKLIDRGLQYTVGIKDESALYRAVHVKFVDGGLDNAARREFLLNIKTQYPDFKRLQAQVAKKEGFLNFFGQAAPELDSPGTWLNTDRPVTVSKSARYVLLDFFAPWCPDCRNSTPEFLELGEELKDRLEIVMVTKIYGFYADEKTKPLRNIEPEKEMELLSGYLKQKNIKIPVFVAADNEAYERFNTSAIPHFVLISPDGKIADLCMERVHDFFTKIRKRIGVRSEH